jgi:integral membrane protein
MTRAGPSTYSTTRDSSPGADKGDRTLTPERFYSVLAIAEAVTWTLLIGGMLLKYAANVETPFTFAVGLIHGVLFIAYAGTAIIVGLNQRWGVGLIVGAAASAVIPYATIACERWLRKNGRLVGGWRTAATNDPRDNTRIDRLLRWMLTHPVLLGAIFVAIVVAIVSTLLSLGPPSEW